MPSDPRDYKLDIGGMKSSGESPRSDRRSFLSIHFACCGVYCRIYRMADGSAYAGHCPKCRKAVRFPIGSGGTDSRTFIVE